MAAKRRIRKGRLFAGRLRSGKKTEIITEPLNPRAGDGAAVRSSSQAVHIPWRWDARAVGRKKRNRAVVLLRP